MKFKKLFAKVLLITVVAFSSFSTAFAGGRDTIEYDCENANIRYVYISHERVFDIVRQRQDQIARISIGGGIASSAAGLIHKIGGFMLTVMIGGINIALYEEIREFSGKDRGNGVILTQFWTEPEGVTDIGIIGWLTMGIRPQ